MGDGYPNLHLMQHEPEVLRDYGPTSAITCFSFERLNKVVGDINTNNRDIERTFSRVATLPHLTGECDEWSAAERTFFATLLSGSTICACASSCASRRCSSDVDPPAGGLRPCARRTGGGARDGRHR